jgi:hypothetical protein
MFLAAKRTHANENLLFRVSLAALIKYVEMSRLDQAIRHIIVSQAEHLA